MHTPHSRTALVTGAAGGIGLAIAESLAQAGMKVAIADLDGTKAQMAAQGMGAKAYACDAADEASLRGALRQVAQDLGPISVLVNNAGLQHVAKIEDFPLAKFDQMLALMLRGPFIAMQEVLPAMKAQKWGRIINMASINGLVGFAGKAAYNSAKHGLIGLSKVAALEAAPFGITVNALCPGYVDTPMVRGQLMDLATTRSVPLEKVLEDVIYPLVPQRRLLTVEEVAAYATFLASEVAGGITGQAVVMDGGYTAQ